MSSLAEREKQLLLEFARRALIAGVEKREPFKIFPTPDTSTAGRSLCHLTLAEPRFRGCVGQLAFERSAGRSRRALRESPPR